MNERQVLSGQSSSHRLFTEGHRMRARGEYFCSLCLLPLKISSFGAVHVGRLGAVLLAAVRQRVAPAHDPRWWPE